MARLRPFSLENILCVVALAKCKLTPAPATFQDLIRFMRGIQPAEESMMLPGQWAAMAITCGLVLQDEYIALRAVDIPDFNGDMIAYRRWLNQQKDIFGETLPVPTTENRDLSSYEAEVERIFDWHQRNARRS